MAANITRWEARPQSATSTYVASPPAAPYGHPAADAYTHLDRGQLIGEILAARQQADRIQNMEFRGYQLRPRKLVSTAQQAAFVAATAHFGLYVLPILPFIAQSFAVQMKSAKGLSYQVWLGYSENAKSRKQGKTIHAALKRHGIIESSDNIRGKLFTNHRRTLKLPIDAAGHVYQDQLDAAMQGVMEDLTVAGFWHTKDLPSVERDIRKIITQFAALTHDINCYEAQWRKADATVKKLFGNKFLGKKPREEIVPARVARAEAEKIIRCGRDGNGAHNSLLASQ